MLIIWSGDLLKAIIHISIFKIINLHELHNTIKTYNISNLILLAPKCISKDLYGDS